MATRKPAPKVTAPLQFTPEQIRAAQDLAARESFPDFVSVMHRAIFGERFVVKPWHGDLFGLFADIYAGRCPRSIVTIAPRSGKTQIAIMFIAWTMGRHPDSEFIISTYAEPLAIKNSTLLQRIVTDLTYQRIFPDIEIDRTSTAKDAWSTTRGGTVRAVGTGGSVQGYGAGKHRADNPDGFGGFILCDDPLKALEARSVIVRDLAWDYFANTLMTRRNDSLRTPVVMLAQRVHSDDPTGRLKAGALGSTWRELLIPALTVNAQREPESFFEEKFPVAELLETREARPWFFHCQLQGEPFDPSGALVKVDRIEILDAEPHLSGALFCRAWDLAGSTSTSADWTVGTLMAALKGQIYVLDVIRFKGTWDMVQDAIKNAAVRDGRSCIIGLPQDPGQAGKAQVRDLVAQLAGFHVRTGVESGNKMTRADPFFAQVNVGNVSAVNAPWLALWLEELRAAPSGKHDDQIDSASRAFGELAGLMGTDGELAERAAAHRADLLMRSLAGDQAARDEATATGTDPMVVKVRDEEAQAARDEALTRAQQGGFLFRSWHPARGVPSAMQPWTDDAGEPPPGLKYRPTLRVDEDTGKNESTGGGILVPDMRNGETHEAHDDRVREIWTAAFPQFKCPQQLLLVAPPPSPQDQLAALLALPPVHSASEALAAAALAWDTALATPDPAAHLDVGRNLLQRCRREGFGMLSDGTPLRLADLARCILPPHLAGAVARHHREIAHALNCGCACDWMTAPAYDTEGVMLERLQRVVALREQIDALQIDAPVLAPVRVLAAPAPSPALQASSIDTALGISRRLLKVGPSVGHMGLQPRQAA
jgi:predicted phage terminase large subunit-like protein